VGIILLINIQMWDSVKSSSLMWAVFPQVKETAQVCGLLAAITREQLSD
jgi:hypothetical protein